MATGIQTGMRTGSRLATGRGPAGGPGGGGPLGKVAELWGKLSPKVKIMLFVVIGLAMTGGLAFTVVSATNKPVELYSTKLGDEDVKQISFQLTEMGIQHHVAITGDQILVHPTKRAEAQMRLAQHGLPRHSIMTAMPSTGMSTKTESEMRQLQQNVLEGQLTETIRQVEGVADAYVKLAMPPPSYFKSDERMTTATVMLKLQPTVTLNREQIKGIMHLIAFSVPELKPENVKIVDTSGHDLTAQVPMGEDGAMSSAHPDEMREKVQKEKQMAVQQALDSVLGAGASRATVAVEFDYSQQETTREVVNNPIKVGGQEVIERYDRGGNAGGENGAQMSGSNGKPGGDYVHEKRAEKFEVSKTTQRQVDRAPRIRRISCSVAVDNLPEEQRAKIAGLVKDAAGLDESRGDTLTVVSLPFQVAMDNQIRAMQETMASGGPPRPAATNVGGLSPQIVAMMMFFPAMILLALVAVFLLKQHRVQQDKSSILLGASGGATASDISDLLNEKTGKSQTMGETRVNTTEQLEKLAKEKPTKVAEMLKSTWLSQGG